MPFNLANSPDLVKAWLALQCSMLPDILSAAVLSADDAQPLATFPLDTTVGAALRSAGRLVVERGTSTVSAYASPEEKGPSRVILGSPLLLDGEIRGAVVIEATSQGEHQQRALMQMLQWGAQWFELFLRRESTSGTRSLATVMEVVATGLEHDGDEASVATATALAGAMGCDRVSIAFLKNGRLRLAAISNTASFDERSNLTRDLTDAMREALDQQVRVVHPWPDEGGSPLSSAHASYCSTHDVGAVITVPLISRNEIHGALTLERKTRSSDAAGFDEQSVDLAEAVASLVGPVLVLKQREERSIVGKVLDSARDYVNHLIGPRHVRTKLATGLLLVTSSVLAFGTGDYRIAGDVTLEGSIQRVIVAPRDGFVATSTARPGDFVREGDVLGTLDHSELTLQRQTLSSQREQHLKGYRQALGNRERAKMAILQAQVEQADAELNLIDMQLERSRLVVPFDGIIVAGSLRNRLGAPVTRGESLFQIAPLEAYRAIVMVDEREVGAVKVGQTGKLALASVPGRPLDIVIERLTPLSEVHDGQNRFRVEARLTENVSLLRPGMRGVGKIKAGERRLAWIWSHDLLGWLRLALWRLLP